MSCQTLERTGRHKENHLKNKNLLVHDQLNLEIGHYFLKEFYVKIIPHTNVATLDVLPYTTLDPDNRQTNQTGHYSFTIELKD